MARNAFLKYLFYSLITLPFGIVCLVCFLSFDFFKANIILGLIMVLFLVGFGAFNLTNAIFCCTFKNSVRYTGIISNACGYRKSFYMVVDYNGQSYKTDVIYGGFSKTKEGHVCHFYIRGKKTYIDKII